MAGTALWLAECQPILAERTQWLNCAFWLSGAITLALLASRRRWSGLILSGSLVFVVLSAALLVAAGIEMTRQHHGLCVSVGHYASGHIHHAHPAGDVADLFLVILTVLWGISGILLGTVGTIALLMNRWRQKRQRPNPATHSRGWW